MPTNNAVNQTDSASAIDFEMPAPGTEGYDEWRKSGKLPDGKPVEHEEVTPKVQEEEIESLEEEPESATGKPAVTRAVPAAAKPQGKKKTGDERIQELANRNRELLERLERLERAPQPSAEPKREAAASQPAAETKKAKPKLGDNDTKTGKPFTSLEAWSDAVDQWNEERLNTVLEERLTKAEQAHSQADQKRRADEDLGSKLIVGREKYDDFDKVAFNPELTIPIGSPVDIFVRNSENSAELLYHLGKHPEILNKFYHYVPGKDDRPGKLTGVFEQLVHPTLQMMEMAKIEARLARDSETPVKQPSAKPITQAPRPPHQVSGKAPTPDPLAKAVDEGDQEAFTRLENERILAKRKTAGRR